jgi:hypothetical protein
MLTYPFFQYINILIYLYTLYTITIKTTDFVNRAEGDSDSDSCDISMNRDRDVPSFCSSLPTCSSNVAKK